MVTFIDGVPSKKNYRKFGKITTPNHKSPVKMFNHLMERHGAGTLDKSQTDEKENPNKQDGFIERLYLHILFRHKI